MVFTVVLRPSLPATAICASLPSLPCKTPAPMGCCGQSGQRANPAKTHFSPPLGLLFTGIPWLQQQSGSLLAASCCVQGRPRLLRDSAGSRQVSHPSMCVLARLPSGSSLDRALGFTTLSSAIAEGLKMCQTKSASGMTLWIQESKVLRFVDLLFPAQLVKLELSGGDQPRAWAGGQHGGSCSCSSSLHHSTETPHSIPQILTNMDKLNLGSSPWHLARQFGDPVTTFYHKVWNRSENPRMSLFSEWTFSKQYLYRDAKQMLPLYQWLEITSCTAKIFFLII